MIVLAGILGEGTEAASGRVESGEPGRNVAEGSEELGSTESRSLDRSESD